MFNLFAHIAVSGIEATLQAHRAELTPLEWVEILFAFPERAAEIPFETWNAEAWTVAILHEAVTPTLAPSIPWQTISKANRRRLLKRWPGLQIPDIRPAARIDASSRIMRSNLFERSVFRAIEPDTGEEVSGCLKIPGVVGSLRGDWDGPFLTCGCGEPGCSGFAEQRNHLSPAFVHWSIRQYDRTFELYFDREAYELGALRLLRPKYLAKWNGSEAYNVSYPNFRAFADDLESLLAANPRLAALWKSLAP
ncbi:MAG: hypothetical protein IJT88_05280 [Kiritimatiellae bacterium]|nr:hypothetical protein [Kiritimatiellia bacterium]